MDIDLTLLLITFFIASIPVGAFAYGFSSTSVPILLTKYSTRQISPILNFIEVFQNIYNLFNNRDGLNRESVSFSLYGIPGIVFGSITGAYLISASVSEFKIIVYLILIPLILLQAYGFRKPVPVSYWKRFGSFITFPIGLLYGISTISGPPLALIINNQGLTRAEFRFNMALLRTVESLTTFSSYIALGVFSYQVIYYSLITTPSIIVGMLSGIFIAKLLNKEDFRRAVMSFDSYISGYGLSSNLMNANYLPQNLLGYFPLFLVIVLDAIILSKYIRARLKSNHKEE